MKYITKYLLLGCLSFVLLSSSVLGLARENSNEITTLNETSSFLPALSYTDHAAIEITSDEEFTLANGVSSGTGTENNPYIIEGWNITVATGYGITIVDTSSHFVIRNCFVDGATEIDGFYPELGWQVLYNHRNDCERL